MAKSNFVFYKLYTVNHIEITQNIILFLSYHNDNCKVCHGMLGIHRLLALWCSKCTKRGVAIRDLKTYQVFSFFFWKKMWENKK